MTRPKPTLDRPEWFPEAWPQPQPERETYWTCWGTLNRSKKSTKRIVGSLPGIWDCINRTAEDAEAHAAWGSDEWWQWDRKPASQVTVLERLQDARRNGWDGVILVEFVDGVWTVTRTWPVGEPYREEK